MFSPKTFFLFFLFLVIFSTANGENCKKKSSLLKIGLITNEFIDYSYYLYYALGEYSKKNLINFDLQIIDYDVEDFDIIFGEYEDLIKLSKIEINTPEIISNFYKNNSISINYNIFPLDLDTFIILSKNNKETLSLNELLNYKNNFKYNFAMSYLSKKRMSNFISYNLNGEKYDFKNHSTESTIQIIKDLFKIQNKNLVFANYNEIYNSFNLGENIFTLFSDGVLLQKDIDYSSFQLFPISEYQWSQNKGLFVQNDEFQQKSFFGFSAYLNNTNSSDFLCFMTSNRIRLKGFEDFNIELSPLSEFETDELDLNIRDEYYDILRNKKNTIEDSTQIFDFQQLKDIVFGELEYKEVVIKSNHLN